MSEFVVTRVMDVADDSVWLTCDADELSAAVAIDNVKRARRPAEWARYPKVTVDRLNASGDVVDRILIECIDPPAVDVIEGLGCPEERT